MSIVGRGISVGGGGGLKVKVVGGTTQPSNPKESMIWVKTSSAIGNVSFTAASPDSPELNDVWISVHSSWTSWYLPICDKPYTRLPVAFGCQWNGSYWQGKETLIYMNSDWHSLKLMLHHDGLRIGSSAAWSAFATAEDFLGSSISLQAPTISEADNGLTIAQANGKRGTAVYGTSSADTIDLSKYSTIKFYYKAANTAYREFGKTSTWPEPPLTNDRYPMDTGYLQERSAATSSVERSLDWSDDTDEKYFVIGILGTQTLTISQLWLE